MYSGRRIAAWPSMKAKTNDYNSSFFKGTMVRIDGAA